MHPVTVCLREGLRLLGFALMVVVGLLLFAITAVALRFLMIPLLVLGLMAVVVSFFSPQFRAWIEGLGQPQVR